MSVPATLPEPIYCRPAAFYYFADQLSELWTTEGLLRGAIAVSMHALDDVSPERVEQQLRSLSERVRALAASDQPSALQAALHQVLFVEEGFGGNSDKYYHALNSYVPAVVNTRRGLPILLSLVYKVVAEWAGLSVAGVNAPGHFMVRVRTETGWQIVDPFYGGEILTRDEVFERLDRVAQRLLPQSDELLAAPTHMQWLYRIIGNLRQLFLTEGRNDDLAAMNELLFALRQTQP